MVPKTKYLYIAQVQIMFSVNVSSVANLAAVVLVKVWLQGSHL